jgi:hypothetical protein
LPRFISQIKGPRNERPDPSTFEFIQDLVRSEKWDRIGDMENVGGKFDKLPDGSWVPAIDNPKYTVVGATDGAYVPIPLMQPHAARAAGFPAGPVSARQAFEWFDNPANLRRYAEEHDKLFRAWADSSVETEVQQIMSEIREAIKNERRQLMGD